MTASTTHWELKKWETEHRRKKQKKRENSTSTSSQNTTSGPGPGRQPSGGNTAFSTLAGGASGQQSQVQICANVGGYEQSGGECRAIKTSVHRCKVNHAHHMHACTVGTRTPSHTHANTHIFSYVSREPIGPNDWLITYTHFLSLTYLQICLSLLLTFNRRKNTLFQSTSHNTHDPPHQINTHTYTHTHTHTHTQSHSSQEQSVLLMWGCSRPFFHLSALWI